jgi:2-dehydropantoate 2-reductase
VPYVVIGCGAIGTVIGAGLVRDGHEVLFCDVDQQVVDTINAVGLHVEGPVEQLRVDAHAVLPSRLPERIDGPVLLAVKAHHTAAAAAQLAGRLVGGGHVISLQNGHNFTAIAEQVGHDRVVPAFVNFGADVIGPGHVMRGNRATFRVGEMDGAISERVTRFAADVQDCEATDNVSGYLWAKQAYGVMLCATAITDWPIWAVFEEPAYAPVLLGLAAEALRCATARPVAFDGFDPADLEGSLRRLAEFNRSSAKTHTGIYRDLAVHHRPTEVGCLFSDVEGPLVRRLEELVSAIESGQRRCERANLDLLATYERLERLGRPLNAVASVVGVTALAGGPLGRKGVEAARTGSLAGAAVAVKDNLAVRGVPTRCGAPSADTTPAPADAEVVARLRRAGAEVVATAQCLEYGAGYAHPDVGMTRNPHDPTRTSGGSSGGSAALVAAGVCDLAVGTDAGGSTRIPASYCGVVGMKPTLGLLPTDGLFPLTPSFDGIGAIARSVAGCRRLLCAMAADLSGVTRAPAGVTDNGRPGSIGVLVSQLEDPAVTPEVATACRQAIAALAGQGWQVHEVRAPWLDELATWERALLVVVAREAHLVHAARVKQGYSEGTKRLLSFGARVTDDDYQRGLRARHEMAAAIDASLGDLDVLVGPTVPYTAPAEDPPFGDGADDPEGRFTAPYNLGGHPALTLPVPSQALPVGLQLAGRRGHDLGVLDVAERAEAVLASL